MKPKEKDNIEIGERLTRLRLAMGVERKKDMAKMLVAGETQYQNWENGTGPIPVPYAIRFCELSGATLDYIYRDIKSGLPLSLSQRLLESDPSN